MQKLSQKPITLIFDFDGTIADTLIVYFDLLNTLADRFNFARFDKNNIDYYRGLNSHQIFSMIDISKFKLPFVVLEARNLLKKEIDKIKPVQGMKEVIEKIKGLNIQTGIITSNSVKNVNSFLKQCNFPDFNFVFSSLRIWQKSAVLKKVISHHKLDPSKVYYIGDETRDIEAAKIAGIKSIAVTWGYNTKEILDNSRPDFLCESTDALSETVLKCNCQ
jgi:phosphoglycolate phosphatase-like HAD superfamily hydrolase